MERLTDAQNDPVCGIWKLEETDTILFISLARSDARLVQGVGGGSESSGGARAIFGRHVKLVDRGLPTQIEREALDGREVFPLGAAHTARLKAVLLRSPTADKVVEVMHVAGERGRVSGRYGPAPRVSTGGTEGHTHRNTYGRATNEMLAHFYQLL